MKKYSMLLGLMLLFAQPAFSQCGPGGCPVNQQFGQSYSPMAQPYQAQQSAYQVQPQRMSQQCNPCAQQCNPCIPQFVMAPNIITGAAAPMSSGCCPNLCPKPRTKWRKFVEDYLGFD